MRPRRAVQGSRPSAEPGFPPRAFPDRQAVAAYRDGETPQAHRPILGARSEPTERRISEVKGQASTYLIRPAKGNGGNLLPELKAADETLSVLRSI